jgi:hypothetical protein
VLVATEEIVALRVKQGIQVRGIVIGRIAVKVLDAELAGKFSLVRQRVVPIGKGEAIFFRVHPEDLFEVVGIASVPG